MLPEIHPAPSVFLQPTIWGPSMTSMRNKIIFVVSMTVMGAIAGAVVWAFLFIMELGIEFIWVFLPEQLDFALFPLVVCVIGGLVIGLHHKFFGDYPESLDTVLEKVKKDKRYEYDNIVSYSTAALLPLIFGASVGPEAGLTGTIAGLCTWVGDRMKRFGSDFKSMTEIGISAALSAIFTAPLFGFAAPMFGTTTGKADDDSGDSPTSFTLPKNGKIVVYLCAIVGAMGTFLLLQSLAGSGGGLPHFSEIEYGMTEVIWTIPLILVGGLAGWSHHLFDAIALFINDKLGERPVIKALIGGLVLAGFGIVLPYTMFAGESQTTEIAESWMSIGAPVLFLTGFFKLFVTAYCIRSGWKGGHFFPAIFSGVSIGLGFAAISGADPVFCMCAAAGALVGSLTKQPILTVLLLFLCFPVKGVAIMILAAAVGSAIPVPKKLMNA